MLAHIYVLINFVLFPDYDSVAARVTKFPEPDSKITSSHLSLEAGTLHYSLMICADCAQCTLHNVYKQVSFFNVSYNKLGGLAPLLAAVPNRTLTQSKMNQFSIHHFTLL